jgi:hypothetical protein
MLVPFPTHEARKNQLTSREGINRKEKSTRPSSSRWGRKLFSTRMNRPLPRQAGTGRSSFKGGIIARRRFALKAKLRGGAKQKVALHIPPAVMKFIEPILGQGAGTPPRPGWVKLIFIALHQAHQGGQFFRALRPAEGVSDFRRQAIQLVERAMEIIFEAGRGGRIKVRVILADQNTGGAIDDLGVGRQLLGHRQE